MGFGIDVIGCYGMLEARNDTTYHFCFATVYNSKLKSEYFDFAIQNGVFHHIIDNKKEINAYKEVNRVLKKGGYFFIHTAGGGRGNLRTATLEAITKILNKFGEDYLRNKIGELPLSNNKKYMIRDNFIVKYKNTTWKKYVKFLKRMGFEFIRPLKGHAKTDFDKFFSKISFNLFSTSILLIYLFINLYKFVVG